MAEILKSLGLDVRDSAQPLRHEDVISFMERKWPGSTTEPLDTERRGYENNAI